MWLFTHYCIPPYSQDLEAKLSQNLEKWTPTLEPEKWVDDRSASILHVDATRCNISTFAPLTLTYEEAAELRALINVFVPKQFPELTFDPKSTLGTAELATAWMHGAVASEERWGIYSFAYPDWGDSAGSILSFARPPQDG